MDKAETQAAFAIPLILAIAVGIVLVAGSDSVRVRGHSLFALCAIGSFAVNWIVFIPAYRLQTERYYDLTGSATYISLVAAAMVLNDELGLRACLLGGLVTVWAARLGSFLFSRVSRDGSDGRFDRIKPSFVRFSMAWTLQALWVFLTLSCALAAMTSTHQTPIGWVGIVGIAIWVLGFSIEVVADRQKSRFRADPANRDQFIQSGIWAWSRHPNYFGEIMLWLGIAILALPALEGGQLITLISPVFVYVLLTRISGIPLLESRGKRRWGHDPAYVAYRERTPTLFPRPPRLA